MSFSRKIKALAGVAATLLSLPLVPHIADASRYDPCLDIIDGSAHWEASTITATFADGSSSKTRHLYIHAELTTAAGCTNPVASRYSLRLENPYTGQTFAVSPSEVTTSGGTSAVSFFVDEGTIVSKTQLSKDLFGNTTSTTTEVGRNGFTGPGMRVHVVTLDASGRVVDAAPDTGSEATAAPEVICEAILAGDPYCSDGGGTLTFFK